MPSSRGPVLASLTAYPAGKPTDLAWDEALHPRAGKGEPTGGQFTFKSGGKTYSAGPGGVREVKQPAKGSLSRKVPETPRLADLPNVTAEKALEAHTAASMGLATPITAADGTTIRYGDTSSEARKNWSPEYREFFNRNGGEAGFRKREAGRAKTAEHQVAAEKRDPVGKATDAVSNAISAKGAGKKKPARKSSVSLELAHGGTIDLSNTREAIQAREAAADDALWDGGGGAADLDQERAEARAMADHPSWTR